MRFLRTFLGWRQKPQDAAMGNVSSDRTNDGGGCGRRDDTYFFAISAGGSGDFKGKTGDYQVSLTDEGIIPTSDAPGTILRGFDTRQKYDQVAQDGNSLKTAHLDFAGMYIGSDPTYTNLNQNQAQALGLAHVQIASLFEKGEMSDTPGQHNSYQYTWETYLTMDQGEKDALAAIDAAIKLHQTPQSAIYFAIDLNPADFDGTLGDRNEGTQCGPCSSGSGVAHDRLVALNHCDRACVYCIRDIERAFTGKEGPVPSGVGFSLSTVYEALALRLGEIGEGAL